MASDPDLDPRHCFERYRSGYYPYFDRRIGKFYWDRESTRAVVPVNASSLAKARREAKRTKHIVVTRNERFEAVLMMLADERLRKETWLKDKVVDVYRALHASNHVLTYEASVDGQLVGGLFAIDLLRVLAVETMIQTSDASNACLCQLMEDAAREHRELVDVQVPHPPSSFCRRLGETVIPLERYLEVLDGAPFDESAESGAGGLARIDERRARQFDAETRAHWPAAEAKVEGDGMNTMLRIGELQVMQEWERPAMEVIAGMCKPNDRVLELGYGLGIAAQAIQKRRPRLHVIVEANKAVASRARGDLASPIAEGRADVVEGFWEETVDAYSARGPYEVIVFDTFPLEPRAMRRNHFEFFPLAARLLAPGGVFTYVSDESLTISTTHQRELRRWFGDARVVLEPIRVQPPASCEYWAAPWMLHVEVHAPVARAADQGRP